LAKGLSRDGAQRLTAARAQAAFVSVDDLARRAGLDRRDLAALAGADALHGLAGHRHDAAWRVAGVLPALPPVRFPSRQECRSYQHDHLDVFLALGGRTTCGSAAPARSDDTDLPSLPVPTEGQEIVADYASLGLSLRRHPLALLRRHLQRRGLLPAAEVLRRDHGQRVHTAGSSSPPAPGLGPGTSPSSRSRRDGHVNLVVWKALASASGR